MFAEAASGVEVAVMTLDESVLPILPDFVKIDTEGNDYKVLFGMKQIVDRNPNIIIMSEYCPDLMIRNGIYPNDLLNLLTNLNMQAFVLKDNGFDDFMKDEYLRPKLKFGIDGKQLIYEDLYSETLIMCRNKSLLEE
jgi:hypothetical protein